MRRNKLVTLIRREIENARSVEKIRGLEANIALRGEREGLKAIIVAGEELQEAQANKIGYLEDQVASLEELRAAGNKLADAVQRRAEQPVSLDLEILISNLRALFSHLSRIGVGTYYTRIIEQAVEYLQHPSYTVTPKPSQTHVVSHIIDGLRRWDPSNIHFGNLRNATIEEIESHYAKEPA